MMLSLLKCYILKSLTNLCNFLEVGSLQISVKDLRLNLSSWLRFGGKVQWIIPRCSIKIEKIRKNKKPNMPNMLFALYSKKTQC